MKLTPKLTINILFILLLLFHLSIVVSANEEEVLRLNSEAAILMDAATGQVLYDHNSSRSMYPASITKIVTGIIAIEEGNLEDIVTVSKDARNVIGTRVYLLEGEQVSLLKLVQGLLINSGNDAGTAIAEHMDQSEQRFAERMNRFVKEKVGVTDTNFTNPHGLFAEEHQTTAYDMAMITRYAMRNELFREVVGTKEMEWIGEGWETTLYNHHLLLWRYEGTNGVKNGYVRQSGNTLVTSVERGDMDLIAVTLKASSAENAYQDTITLLDYGFSHFQINELAKDKIFFDSDKNEYHLLENIQFTSKIDEEVALQVSEAGELVIIGQDGEITRQQKLEKIKDETDVLTIVDEQQSERLIDSSKDIEIPLQRGNGFILWFSIVLYQVFLLLIAYLLIQKYRKNKQRKGLLKRRYHQD